MSQISETKPESIEPSSTLQPIHTENPNDIDPLLDRSTSCFSVASSLSPVSSPQSSHDVPDPGPLWSMVSTSPQHRPSSQLPFPENYSPEHDFDNSGCDESEPGYDPNRIPSSVFGSKPSNPTDWSVASNESLFSIHMGNSSFTRDELIDRKSTSSPLPALAEVSSDRKDKSARMSVSSQPPQDNNDDDNNNEMITQQEHNPEASPEVTSGRGSYVHESAGGTPQSEHFKAALNSPRMSTTSQASCQSFAFPVLVKDVSKKKGSQPQAPEPQPPPQPEEEAKPETPKETSKATESRFACFSCWPRCC